MSTDTSTQVVPLDLLRPNESGLIVEMVASDEWLHRLKELGLREGAKVRMVRPGCPCIVAVDGHRFTYRCDPSTLILVELQTS